MLSRVGKLKGGFALDVGCGKAASRKLEEFGFEVYGFDRKHENPEHRLKFEDFETDQKYDLVLISNVLWFLDDPIFQIERYSKFLKPDGVMCFNVLAPEDDWAKAGKYEAFTKAQFQEVLSDINLKTVFDCQIAYDGRSLSETQKHWEMLCYVCLHENASTA